MCVIVYVYAQLRSIVVWMNKRRENKKHKKKHKSKQIRQKWKRNGMCSECGAQHMHILHAAGEIKKVDRMTKYQRRTNTTQHNWSDSFTAIVGAKHWLWVGSAMKNRMRRAQCGRKAAWDGEYLLSLQHNSLRYDSNRIGKNNEMNEFLLGWRIFTITVTVLCAVGLFHK